MGPERAARVDDGRRWTQTQQKCGWQPCICGRTSETACAAGARPNMTATRSDSIIVADLAGEFGMVRALAFLRGLAAATMRNCRCRPDGPQSVAADAPRWLSHGNGGGRLHAAGIRWACGLESRSGPGCGLSTQHPIASDTRFRAPIRTTHAVLGTLQISKEMSARPHSERGVGFYWP